MSLTKLIIANRALNKVGAKKLVAFGENTPSGVAISDAYDTIRDEVLAEHPFSFAQRRISLVNITASSTTPNAWVANHTYVLNDYVVQAAVNYICLVAHTSGVFATDLAAGDWGIANATIPFTNDGMKVAYAMPSGVVKINYINQPGATYKIENILIGSTATPVILSDTLNLKIQYTYSDDDPTNYFSMFVNALVTRLAAEICFQLTESAKKTADLMQLYIEVDLPKACSSDSQQGTPDQPQQDQWENARMVAGATIWANPGDKTWHPVF